MLGLTIDIDERAVIAHLEQFPAALQRALVPPITRLTGQLLAQVVAAEHSRTGKLRSDTRSFVDVKENAVLGRIRILGDGLPNLKAAALEYGSHRSVEVKAHPMQLAHVWGRAMEPRAVMVAAFRRQTNIAAERFLHDPFAGISAEATAQIEQTVTETARAF
jgi:hypothetical protein